MEGIGIQQTGCPVQESHNNIYNIYLLLQPLFHMSHGRFSVIENLQLIFKKIISPFLRIHFLI